MVVEKYRTLGQIRRKYFPKRVERERREKETPAEFAIRIMDEIFRSVCDNVETN